MKRDQLGKPQPEITVLDRDHGGARAMAPCITCIMPSAGAPQLPAAQIQWAERLGIGLRTGVHSPFVIPAPSLRQLPLPFSWLAISLSDDPER